MANMNDSSLLHDMVESTPMCSAKKSRLTDSKINMSLPPSPIMPFHSSTPSDSLLPIVKSWNLYHETIASSSAPTTPPEFYKNHYECLQKTPLKSSSSSKLGSPERNEIISGRKPTAIKWTPKGERASPAKKRLFGLHHISNGSITKSKSLLAAHSKHDPVVFFTKRSNIPFIMEKILGDLQAVDLYNCRKVNHTWRETVDSFPAFEKSAAEYANKLWVNKENPEMLKCLQEKQMPNANNCNNNSIVLPEGDKFIQLGTTLKENQRLTKCPRCQHPQIIEYNIGQCQNYHCGYICCFKCSSFSIDGPEHFVDKCNGAILDIRRPPKRRTLLDSPPLSQLSFFASSSPVVNVDNSHLFGSTTKDSGYATYDDSSLHSFTPNSKNNSSSNSLLFTNSTSNNFNIKYNSVQRKSLGDSNRQEECRKSQSVKANLYIPVLPMRGKSPEKSADDSPVKEYQGACTKVSKKRLRRLLR